MPQSNDRERIRKQRMAPEHSFMFRCDPGVSCFTQCCQDISILLTPYDVMRLKNRLGMPSGEFLEKHVHIIPKHKRLIPMVILKMNE